LLLTSQQATSLHYYLCNGWFKTKESKQNRAMAFVPDWLINFVHDRLVQRKILDPSLFKKDCLPYSSVWIDSNTTLVAEPGGCVTAVSMQVNRSSVLLFLLILLQVLHAMRNG
jgi:hypothetical protein